ncbi:hypothetical protein HF521_004083, partial [Silurus meridionalis]
FAGSVIREYIYYPYGTQFVAARSYCTQNYRDLASITTAEEQQRILKVFGNNNDPIWIGLNWNYDHSNWQWTDGQLVSFSQWFSGFPIIGDSYNPNNCVFLKQQEWRNTNYWNVYPFYCYRYLILVNESKTWVEALQSYCTQNYRDLASITTAEEQQRILKVFGNNNDPIWIGLYWNYDHSNWQWTDGQLVSFSKWFSGFPINGYFNYPNNCGYLTQQGWKNTNYWNVYPFYCYRYLILVNESKTWVEALQYCTTNYKGFASLPSTTQMLQAKTEMVLTQTESVWTGLRFMDGKWFWVNGEPVENRDSLLPYPAHPYRCGALNNMTNVWENRNCNETLNFLC